MFDTAYIFLSGALVVLGLISLYGLRPIVNAIRATKSDEEATPGENYQLVSVIVPSQAENDHLAETVKAICAQDYPAFEVIVVVDGSPEDARILGERLNSMAPRVYVTYIQPGSHNLSRRKLALTLGIKAAKGDVVLTTGPDIEIPSSGWLSSMMRPFQGEVGKSIDVVLGATRIDLAQLHGPGKWFVQFDNLLSNALWIGYAANGKPYRGDGYNLAFRRSVFFAHKGYAASINVHAGDDDLFINEIANGGNTRVVADRDSVLTLNWGQSTRRVLSLRKASYIFTSRWLPRGPFFRSATMQACQWLLPLLCGFAAWFAWSAPVMIVSAACILLAGWGLEIYWYRRLAKAYGAVRLWWAVVPFWLWRPLANIIFRAEHRNLRKKNFTWVR